MSSIKKVSLESYSHKYAKQLLRQWLFDDLYRHDTGHFVSMEYPFFEHDNFPYAYFYDEYCGLNCDEEKEINYDICDYRSGLECPCLRCNELFPKYIADVAVGYKGGLTEVWEVVNKHDLTADKLMFYQWLRYQYNVDFYIIPEVRILHQVDIPNINELRRDHCG